MGVIVSFASWEFMYRNGLLTGVEKGWKVVYKDRDDDVVLAGVFPRK